MRWSGTKLKFGDASPVRALTCIKTMARRIGSQVYNFCKAHAEHMQALQKLYNLSRTSLNFGAYIIRQAIALEGYDLQI